MTSNDFKVSELVSRAKQNDLEAFEELVVLYQDKLFGQCYQLTRNYDDAQDLAQEVFVRAYRRLDSFRQRAWL
ncbi:MAG: sigma factor, partial [Syntrophothermaceae bacterium]